MILPYDTSMSYWMMAIPRLEWQPEPQGTAASTAAPVDADAAASSECGNDEPALPRLRLVITGVNWVAVPFWSPRENASWNAMADAARDEDRQRSDSKGPRTMHAADDAPPAAAPGKARP